ncbi:MAG: beta-aspartyl-peptidase [Bacteroidetes bacterium]|nr:MAG: beta-aspartyl-peptidase [Bacteroidota bacterium]
MLLIKNATVYSPLPLGKKDILVGAGKILAIENEIANSNNLFQVWDAQEKIVTPGFIDQHIHIIGAGGKHGFGSMTPEVSMSELVACGSTTVVGLLGTDGSARSIKSLYAKTKSLESEGLSAYMFTGYYGLDPVYITESVQEDMIFIEPVLGCKIAITDIRSSYPTDLDLLRILRQVKVGGMLANKKGILHLHLGNLKSKMDVLFKLVEEHEFPIAHISPTHVGRTKALFEQAIQFAKLGGIIDITTGASKYTEPYKMVLYALEEGVPIDKMTFSSDGNAGLDKLDENGNLIGFRRAVIDQNYRQVKALINNSTVKIEDAVKLITTNPATNLGLKNKGSIKVGYDADFCCLTNDFTLTDVFAKGKQVMENSQVIVKGHFE